MELKTVFSQITPECLLLVIAFAPLVSAFAGLFSRQLSFSYMKFFMLLCMIASSAAALVIFKLVVIGGQSFHLKLLSWLNLPDLKVQWSIYVDSLTAMMLAVVTGVSLIVHIYSLGYMGHDPHPYRFMSYLSLFTFAMISLVTSDNLLQLFFGWEGVGLCSYLLIGFWFKKDSANQAAIKAFVTNRVSDFAFVLGIFTIYKIFGSLEYQVIFPNLAKATELSLPLFGYQVPALELAAVLLFIGCMGKSAQVPLHVWLPDAMEGPTPVSALIHAATMVTAGVFLVARFSPLYQLFPGVLYAIAVIGTITCLFAATIALTQNDIKKIIAYSTCSQLGYMFIACGFGNYPAAIFHLATHAFFKALLFLGAGNVIHAMSDEQNIHKMGGLWRKIPVTYVLMLIGSLAICGIYPFAGFYSKDAIIASAYHNDASHIIYYAANFGALLTAFYSWRLIFLVFHGTPRYKTSIAKHIHESPLVMNLPLVLLALGAIASGYYGEEILHILSPNQEMWYNALARDEKTFTLLSNLHHLDAIYAYLPMIISIFGIASAFMVYVTMAKKEAKKKSKTSPIYNLVANKYYIDEIYHALLVKPLQWCAEFFASRFDRLIDFMLPIASGRISIFLGRKINDNQTGLVYNYGFVMMLGLAIMLAWLIFTLPV